MGKETANIAGKSSVIKRILRNPISGPYIALILLFIISSIASPEIFPTFSNVANILRQASVMGMVSIGMTVVLLVAGIDLSVTYIMAICACVMANMMEKSAAAGNNGMAIGALIFVLLIGCLVGLVNGSIIVLRGAEPFIITLGTGQVIKGITYIYTKGAPGGTVTEFWKNFGSESFLNLIPYAVLLYAVMMVVFMILLHKTVYGRHIYAIGSNEEAARLTGIKVKINKIIAYVLCGFTAALAGVMLLARVRVGEPNGSSGYDMDAIAAVVIGGTAMSGGRGNLAGTLAGVLIMAIMNNILNLVGADPNLQIVIKGLIILVAVLIQRKDD
ncbi:ABC transporter permease [Mediterraneibacter sp. NSJ-55]|uniref:Autoinducer 2 import system permease protein LsrD n=1 Tax=Mediterraneibacter hominis TaxID=2763054 RepID=A0A923LIS9_9FIRM|nr:ABC transporter permease [Mediterraneibacter hominis]